MLGGVYEIDRQIDQFMKAFIEELTMPQEVKDLGLQSLQISLESQQAFSGKANERISCYPGALSFATVKAGAVDNLITELECDLINITLSSGYSSE